MDLVALREKRTDDPCRGIDLRSTAPPGQEQGAGVVLRNANGIVPSPVKSGEVVVLLWATQETTLCGSDGWCAGKGASTSCREGGAGGLKMCAAPGATPPAPPIGWCGTATIEGGTVKVEMKTPVDLRALTTPPAPACDVSGVKFDPPAPGKKLEVGTECRTLVACIDIANRDAVKAAAPKTNISSWSGRGYCTEQLGASGGVYLLQDETATTLAKIDDAAFAEICKVAALPFKPVLTCCGLDGCPACTDGIKNGAETDEDCGGGKCGKCFAGQSCVDGPRDCESGVCLGGACD